PDIYASIRWQPMIFFVAKGEPGACGPGCSEWIAAEGMIDPDAGQRLRDFVVGLQRRDLPIFFNSMGGLAGQAVSLGVVMREHSIANAHHILKGYMIEMGVDPALIDVAAKVSADRVHILTRDEIARFGIEARDVYETPWMPYEDVSKRFYLLKAVTQATATEGT